MAGYLDQYMMTPEERARAAAILRNSRHPFAIAAQTPAALSQGVQDAIEYPQQKGRDARTYVDNTVNSALNIPRQAGRNARGMLNNSVDAAGNYLGTLSPYSIGQDVGDGGRFLLGGVTGAVEPILDSIPQAAGDFYDAGADAAQGGGNFFRGMLGLPEDISQGERYSTGDTPVGDVLNEVMSADVKGSLNELGEAAKEVYTDTSDEVSGALTQQQVAPPATSAPVLAPDVTQEAALTQGASGNAGQIFSADSARYTTPYNSVFPPNSSLGNNTPRINSRAVTMERMRDAALVDRSNTQSDNKRNNTSTNIPRTRIDLSEKLIRIGGAIMGGSNLGALNALQAGAAEYGAIKDSGRNQLREDEALQLEYDKLAADQATGNSGLSNAEIKQQLEDSRTADQYQEEIAAMDIVLAGLNEFGDTVTGPLDGTAGAALDNQSDDPVRSRRALLRSQMQQITLNETLRNTAKTKGAITDREMALFKEPQPKMTQGEGKWREYIKDRRDALARIHNRLRNNIRVDYNTGAQINAAGVNRPSVYSPSEQAALDKYTQ